MFIKYFFFLKSTLNDYPVPPGRLGVGKQFLALPDNATVDAAFPLHIPSVSFFTYYESYLVTGAFGNRVSCLAIPVPVSESPCRAVLCN